MKFSTRTIIRLSAGLVVLAVLGIAGAIALLMQPTGQASASNPLAAAATPTPAKTDQANNKPDQYVAFFSKAFASRLGVDEAKLNEAFAAAISDTADQAVKDNQLTPEQANRAKQNAQKGGFGMSVAGIFKQLSAPALDPLGQAEGAAFEAAGGALGLTPDQLKQSLSTGKSISELAQERKVDLQKVKDAMLAGVKTRLDAGVQKGLWSQTEADEAYKNAPAMIDKLINSRPGADHGNKGDLLLNPKTLLIGGLDDVAKLLNLSRAELDAKWKLDSLANIAKSQNVEVAQVKDTMFNSFKRQTADGVKAGKLTQAQADEVYSQAADHVDEFIQSVPESDKSRKAPPPATPTK
jgi:lipoate-protein ligase A